MSNKDNSHKSKDILKTTTERRSWLGNENVCKKDDVKQTSVSLNGAAIKI